jgi:hypothetical protein
MSIKPNNAPNETKIQIINTIKGIEGFIKSFKKIRAIYYKNISPKFGKKKNKPKVIKKKSLFTYFIVL